MRKIIFDNIMACFCHKCTNFSATFFTAMIGSIFMVFRLFDKSRGTFIFNYEFTNIIFIGQSIFTKFFSTQLFSRHLLFLFCFPSQCFPRINFCFQNHIYPHIHFFLVLDKPIYVELLQCL